MDDERSPEQFDKKLSKEQKAGFALLAVFAVIVIVLGVVQIRNTMYSPFQLGSGVPSEVGDEVNGVESLAYRDTDNDGLSDFDELYVYGSSPYLNDTDSDGVSDGEEVQGGSNPLCPQGKICTSQVASGDSSGVSASGTLSYSQLSQFATDYDFTQDARSAQLAFINQMKGNPDLVRKLLSSQGMSAQDLDSLSDSDIENLIQKALEESSNAFSATPTLFSSSLLTGSSVVAAAGDMVSGDSQASVAGAAVSNVKLPAELVEQLSDPKLARELLVKQGLDKTTIDQMTDEQIAVVIQEILNKLQTSSLGQ